MSSICQRCGAVIEWRWTGARWQPMNLDGSVHFPTCRQRVEEGRSQIEAWYETLKDEQRKAVSHSDKV